MEVGERSILHRSEMQVGKPLCAREIPQASPFHRTAQVSTVDGNIAKEGSRSLDDAAEGSCAAGFRLGERKLRVAEGANGEVLRTRGPGENPLLQSSCLELGHGTIGQY